VSPPAEKGKGKEAEPDPPVFWPFSRWRVGSRAAIVHAGPEGFPALLWILRGCFVILNCLM